MNEVKVDISGTVATDPVLRRTRAGAPFLSFRVAVNPRRWNAQEGTWSDGDPQFFSVTAFRALAANAYHSLAKGQHVIVTGRFRMTQYEASDGSMRTSAQIDAHDIGPSLKFGQTAFTKCVHPEVPSTDRLAEEAVTNAMRELEEGDGQVASDAEEGGEDPVGTASGRSVAGSDTAPGAHADAERHLLAS